MMNGKIYEITNIVNGKRYFGQTIEDRPEIRWNSHKHFGRKAKRPSSRLYNSMRKHGVENFRFKVIIDRVHSQEELNRLEMIWIRTCRTMEPDEGYNLTEGGAKGKFSEESKAKIAERLRGNKNSVGTTRTEEQKRAQSERRKGVKKDAEFAEKCRKRQLGVKPTPQANQKRAEFMKANPNAGQIKKGATLSEKTCRRMSASRMGRTSWNTGLTKETDERVRNAYKKTISLLESTTCPKASKPSNYKMLAPDRIFRAL